MLPPTATESHISKRIQESCSVQQALAADPEFCRLVGTVAEVITAALRNGNKVLFFGNGGSAADAQHLAAELAGRYLHERPPLAGMALTVNSSLLTAVANDYDFSMVFARQIDGLGKPGDVAVGISTSGNSANVIRGLQAAAAKGMSTIALAGKTGGKMRDAVQYCLCMPTEDTPRIQECHILIGHIICELVEAALCSGAD